MGENENITDPCPILPNNILGQNKNIVSSYKIIIIPFLVKWKNTISNTIKTVTLIWMSNWWKVRISSKITRKSPHEITNRFNSTFLFYPTQPCTWGKMRILFKFTKYMSPHIWSIWHKVSILRSWTVSLWYWLCSRIAWKPWQPSSSQRLIGPCRPRRPRSRLSGDDHPVPLESLEAEIGRYLTIFLKV